jgi:hypothetical protein
MTTPDHKEALDGLLARADLPIEPDEYDMLLRLYPMIRAETDALRIDEVRYADPADIYSAAPKPQ